MSRLAWQKLKLFSSLNPAVPRLGGLFLLAIMITFWVAGSPVVAEGLFQSPQSPAPAEAQPPPPAGGEQPAPTEAQPAPAPTAEQPPPPPAEPERPVRDRSTPTDEAPADSSGRNFILDQVELVDSVVVSGAYLWLCCGVLLFLLVPIFMLIVYIRGRSKLRQREQHGL